MPLEYIPIDSERPVEIEILYIEDGLFTNRLLKAGRHISLSVFVEDDDVKRFRLAGHRTDKETDLAPSSVKHLKRVEIVGKYCFFK